MTGHWAAIVSTVLTELWAVFAAPPLPMVLAGGAGAVVGTAAALSGWAAHRPDLPTHRWSRLAPATLVRIADARATHAVLRALGFVGVVAGIVTLARRDAPVEGLAVIPLLTGLSLIAGPLVRLINPLPAARSRGTDHLPRDGRDLRVAATWLLALCAIALSTRSPRVMAVTAAGYVLLQATAAWCAGRRDDPFEAYAELVGHLAPIGRDHDRRLVWRNPLVATAHATPPRGAVVFGAVVIAASLTSAATSQPETLPDGGAIPALLFGVTLVVVVGALRLSVIRSFFRSATIPLVAAYGVVAAGRWWQPVDLLVFVALHTIAVAVLHRQALARYDLRTARAVQFPLRVVFVASVVGGLALLVGP
jgi:hypothetical protein